MFIRPRRAECSLLAQDHALKSRMKVLKRLRTWSEGIESHERGKLEYPHLLDLVRQHVLTLNLR